MGRADLHSTFTKITLWRLLQFRRIVFIDADVVALRAPDELFALPHAFAAAPDIGWPDIFNSGVMLLTPNMGDYYALQAMAERGISFDGADQGLLNTYFKHTFHRLAFTYNVTPSAHYQYLPAYKHFASSISMAHFIGKEKPWSQGRSAGQGSTPHDELVARWWAVYDRHYKTSPEQKDAVSPYVQSLVAGEYRRNHVKFALEPPLIVEAEEKSEPEDSPRASVDLPEAEILPEPTTVLLPESPSAPDPVPEPVQDTWDAKTYVSST